MVGIYIAAGAGGGGAGLLVVTLIGCYFLNKPKPKKPFREDKEHGVELQA